MKFVRPLSLALIFTLSLLAQNSLNIANPGSADFRRVGSSLGNSLAEPDGKLVHPAGDSLAVPGKASDIVPTPDGSLLLVKSGHGLSIIDVKTFKVIQTLVQKEVVGSMHGLAVIPAPDGRGWLAYFTSTKEVMLEARIARDGTAEWGRRIPLGSAQNWGVSVSSDGKLAYVCLSIRNVLGIVDLAAGRLVGEVPVGVAPYDVCLAPDEQTAYVTNFGGSHPAQGQPAQKSAGTEVSVDARDIANSGSVSVVDLKKRSVITEIRTGLHPTQIIRDAKGSRYFVAEANSDSVSVIAGQTRGVVETVLVRPDAKLPFGSIPDALCLGRDEKTLYVADAGNDAVAVVKLGGEKSEVQGFIPTGWFPGGVARVGSNLYVANTKGETINRVAVSDAEQLKSFTAQVMADEKVPQALGEMERSRSVVGPVPVPAHPGEPSVFKHVIYILKENKTYDQVLGDIGKGNSDPKLCTYGKAVTPNHHALAKQFVLLDNYYCNGVNSSDGHQWATQGIVGDYFEKGSRTYDFGTDALCYASSDFLWDSCLLHGLSIRNYGEFDFPTVTGPFHGWFDVFGNWKKNGSVSFRQSVELSTLMQYTCREYPGWNLEIPDACRAKVFLDELAAYQKSGEMPNFLLIYLPQDHTAGTRKSVPTPRAMVADNDLAMGQIVEAISNSRFWKDTCIFVNEDDPQSGYDHVDGHRSLCLIASPYTKRGMIVSRFYNQTSVLHTMTRMLGLPPLNQICATASTMEDCFSPTPDFNPYRSEANTIPLDEPNPARQAMTPPERDLAEAVDRMDFTRPDRVQAETFNRLLWLSAGRVDPYPAAFAGAHGKGLAALHLKLEKTPANADKDDD
jgi:DNA-binding beta-propeller fold protein YncE